MCGITGFINSHADQTADALRPAILAMTEALAHRGPDDAGYWIDPAQAIALGHRRLAILDLSPEGHQPMHSASGRFVMVYNGEIFNYRTIRDELIQRGYSFRGGSDTEVMLAAFEEWGVMAVPRFIGMFALALVDRQSQVVHLIRDRLGIKPLYYGWVEGGFVFGSEIKPLRRHPGWNAAISRDALASYFQYNYISAPHSIYQGIYKLPPGCVLTLPLTEKLHREGFSPYPHDPQAPCCPTAYWSVQDFFLHGANRPFAGNPEEAADELEALLADAVSLRMLSDRPIGAFLSGGIDSSLIVALMQRASSQPVRTFTIGFEEGYYNEAQYAQEVASHLGTDHTTMMVTPQDALDSIPLLPQFYDEPFADSSQVPSYLLCKETRQFVTVALSGDGGDEIFAGYNRYRFLPKIWQTVRWMPYSARRALSWPLMNMPRAQCEAAAQWLGRWVPPLRSRNASDSVTQTGQVMAAADLYQAHDWINATWQGPLPVRGGTPASTLVSYLYQRQGNLPKEGLRMMLLKDQLQCLPEDMLTKVDRASMGVSLEVRVPLIDHRVVEFAATLPPALLFEGGNGKAPLRRLVHRYVPASILDRPKQGFQLPVARWLSTSLRDWGETLLDAGTIQAQGYLDPKPIRRQWEEHIQGKRDWTKTLWAALMFQAWLEKNE
ncbi:MAG: asparagine synthase (glutamine-hydrolyzing) [bacterium]|jgi:asparagine synthase (glutamine-hydrolysing)|nr:asparagine synthase (glutamine-hydrolyzing) [bacterium]